MPSRTFRQVFPLILLILLLSSTPALAQSRPLFQIPPPGHLYHGVHPGGPSGAEDDITLAGVQAYEQAAGKKAAWVYFSHNWYNGREFPWETVDWIKAHGSVPFIRLMLRDTDEQNRPNQTFTVSEILKGSFDRDLRAWAREAADYGEPLLAEYGTEVNGEWFPWNGEWQGGGKTNEYGDKALADGPERFRDAYRHIIDLARSEGAHNILWAFHVNNDDVPNEPWNRLENYYPGPDYIDILGVSIYGAQTPTDEEWPIFRDSLDQIYPRLKNLDPTKPILVLEIGVTQNHPSGQQETWAKAALTDLESQRWPDVIGFNWWNETWPNDETPAHDTDMQIQTNPAATKVFQDLIGQNKKILDRLKFD